MRWIAHLDMDAFYASVELLRYPELRGLPVVVGGGSRHPPVLQPDGSWRFARLKDYAGRGVITTATYEARALGVHSGLGLMKAAALAPDAVLLPTDFDRYRKFSRLFKAAVTEVAPTIEDRGIDEIYIDLTEVVGAQDSTDDDPHAGVRALAQEIKARVRAATGLTCSIGLTPNMLLSKICSDLEKPNGLTIVTEADIPTRIWPLPAKCINGIGPKADERLAAMGIRTIGDLAAANPQTLIERFGPNYGAWLHAAAHGRDERPVVTYREPKSLSRETTFERDLHPRTDRATLGEIFTELCQRVAEDLRLKGYVARTVGVKLRYDDFRIATRELSLPLPTGDAKAIRHAAGLCLKRMALDRKLRLLGVRVGTLCRPDLQVAEPVAAYPSSADDATLPLF
jgi:DNA polymerase-4